VVLEITHSAMGAYPVHLQGYGFLRARRCGIPVTPGSVAPAQRKI